MGGGIVPLYIALPTGGRVELADFQHLMRISEQDCAADARRYRRSVGWFACLGYLWVLGCAALGLALLAYAWQRYSGGQGRLSLILVAVTGGGLLLASLQSLWLRLQPPEGEALSPAQAPELFEGLERIRKAIKGPPIHQVRINAEFNACIVQIPRWGLLGRPENHLVIGLPLLYALERRRALAVLAHEYGHLRGGHGSFSAWIYRSRMAWQRLAERLDQDEGLMASLSRRFFAWYAPRFVAKSFALARQDEFEADRIAQKLLGAEVMEAALKEIEIKSAWLASEFWPWHWRRAQRHEVPKGPMHALKRRLLEPPEPRFAQTTLEQAWRRLAQVDDTHPALRERIEALQPQALRKLPEWSRDSAIKLLQRDTAERLAETFDAQWCRANGPDWQLFRQDLLRWAARREALLQQPARSPDEQVELARLSLRLDPGADVRGPFFAALASAPDHPEALRGLALALQDSDRAQSLAVAQHLYELGPAERWWAARHAVALLEHPVDDLEALKRWRQRLAEASAVEDEAWRDLLDGDWLQDSRPHELSPAETEDLVHALRREPRVISAWLCAKTLKAFPWRRCYLLVLDLPDCDAAAAQQLCQQLTRHLPLPGPGLVAAVQFGIDPYQAPLQSIPLR